MKRIRTSAIVMAMAVSMGLVGTASLASAAAPPGPYSNGFENPSDVITGVTSDTQAMFDVNRVPSPTGGISAASGTFFATAAQNPSGSGTLSQFTRLGGDSRIFPPGGVAEPGVLFSPYN